MTTVPTDTTTTTSDRTTTFTENTEDYTETTEDYTETTEGQTTSESESCPLHKLRTSPVNCRFVEMCKEEGWVKIEECNEGEYFDDSRLACMLGACEIGSTQATPTTLEATPTKEPTRATTTAATEFTEDFTETTEEFTESTEDFTESTEDFTESTDDSANTTEDLSETSDPSENTENVTTEDYTETTKMETEIPVTEFESCRIGAIRASPANCRFIEMCKEDGWRKVEECQKGEYFDDTRSICILGSCETATETPFTEVTTEEFVTEGSGEGETLGSGGEEDGGEETDDTVTELPTPTPSQPPTKPPTQAPTIATTAKPRVNLLNNTNRLECTITGETAAHKHSINKFRICIYGIYEEVSCPPGLIFHEKSSECRYAVPGEGCVTGSPTLSVRDDCSKFLFCVGDSWMVEKCPEGKQFSPTSGKCLDDYDCEQVEKCRKGQKRSHLSSCNEYKVCTGVDKWTVKKCEEGKIFNPMNGLCGPGVCKGIKPLKCGVVKDDDYHPWTVSLLFEYTSTSGRKRNQNVHECGGALISKRWVLTSRNCFIHDDERRRIRTLPNPKRWLVKSGLDRYQISSIIIHPIKDGLFSDLALVKLVEPVQLSSYRNKICLPARKSKAKLGADVHVTSWELHLEDSTLVPRTHMVKIPKKIPMKCNKFYGYTIGQIAPDTDCVAKDDFETSKCTHDTGSPVVTVNGKSGQYSLYALLSGKLNCGHDRDPSLYQRIQPHLPWITSKIN